MNDNNIVFRVIGDKSPFKKSLVNLFDYAENLTKDNTGMIFNVAINYGGKMDIIHSVKKISDNVSKGLLKKDSINEDHIRKNLISNKVSDIDLLIRSSGEQRLSNFMFWQLAYSEIYFTQTLWPDFSEKELMEALDSFSSRERRYGASLAVNKK